MELTSKEKQAYQAYQEAVRRIRTNTASIPAETPEQKRKRVANLLGNFEAFCVYYFPDYCSFPFGWFHKRAVNTVVENANIFAVFEFPREHAKSVLCDLLLTLYLKAKGELSGMIIASANKDKATGLLLDIQAQLEGNQRYINDFGEQYSFGDWESGSFSTADGVGFWAFGRGESPRGTRKREKRPNYVVVDDIDDAEIVRNEGRVRQAVDWVLGDLYGAVSIKQGRFIVVGNRIHQKSILAHIVGDVNEGDPVKDTVYHLKVFALENPKTHKEDQSEKGVPAWKEKYTREELLLKFSNMGYRGTQREFFHKHIIEGTVFSTDWLDFVTVKSLQDYQLIITYNDPSFKDTKKNDFKAIMVVGKLGIQYHILDCWVAQASTGAMVRAHYDINDRLLSQGCILAKHYIEGNFMQDMLIEDYQKEAIARGYMLHIRADERKKPDKFGRIENLTPLFERGLIKTNIALRKSIHYLNYKDQLLGFPNAHDDAPDALEGAIHLLNVQTRTNVPTTIGSRRRENAF